MTDDPATVSRYRLPWRSDRSMAALGPARRVLARNPALLVGAAVLGIVGVLAWRNRERIAEKTAPLIEDARAKGQELIEEAKVRGQELIEEAKAKTQAVARKARRSATPESTTTELH